VPFFYLSTKRPLKCSNVCFILNLEDWNYIWRQGKCRELQARINVYGVSGGSRRGGLLGGPEGDQQPASPLSIVKFDVG
jgi:hypothetical protein